MKSLAWAGVVALVLCGCASPRSSSNADKARNLSILMTNMMPLGAKRVFEAPYNLVWRAAVDAAQQGDLEMLSADRTRGSISVRSGAGVESAGENLTMSVRSLGPSGTEVEVLSRATGPRGVALKSWENEIIRAIGANLTRESPAVGSTGTQVYIQNQVDGESTTIVPPRARATKITSESRLESHRGLDKLRDIERRVADLRAKQREREAALEPEQDEDRREEIRAEIERLREELRLQEERLAELERGSR